MTSQPGFRFFPTEEELVSFYLHNKLLSGGGDDNLNRAIARIIPVLDIYAYNPWDLPQKSGEVCNNIDHDDPDQQWFFFIPKQESQVRGGKPNRLTTTGYWKATGSTGLVYSTSNNRGIGVKRSMVFYIGRAPKGTKTVWKMNEYKAFVASTPSPSNIANISSTGVIDLQLLRQEFSLCRVYKKSKLMRSFDRRPSPPAVLLIGDSDDNDRHEEDGGTNQQHPLHHINNNIGYNQVTRTSDDHVMCQIPVQETPHHNQISNAMINPHNYKNNSVAHDVTAGSSSMAHHIDHNVDHHIMCPVHETPHHNQISNAMINPHNYKNNSVAHDVTAGSSSMAHHIDHNVDVYGDRPAFSDWDFDWDSYWD